MFWILVIGNYLYFGAWDLVLIVQSRFWFLNLPWYEAFPSVRSRMI
jgi:hypothetical protein